MAKEMLKDRIVMGNRLIAEFMGHIKCTRCDGCGAYMFGSLPWYPSEMLYHKDFNWTMEVVQRIEKGNFGVKMCRKRVEIYYDDTKATIVNVKCESRMESLHLALVTFIKLHNKNLLRR